MWLMAIVLVSVAWNGFQELDKWSKLTFSSRKPLTTLSSPKLTFEH